MKLFTFTVSILISFGAAVSSTAENDITLHPKFRRSLQKEKADHEYIVRLFDSVEPEDVADVMEDILELSELAEVVDVYTTAIKGFSIKMEGNRLQAILDHKEVEYVEENPIFQPDAEMWNKDRIDQRSLPLTGKTMETGGYFGSGVTIYIIDQGIRLSHESFEGRASCAADYTGETSEPCGTPTNNSHGTHVAGIAAGKDTGVARKATIKSLKVCTSAGCKGSDIIQAWNYVAERSGKRVANKSLGGSFWQTQEDAIKRVVDSGAVVTVSAGNDNTDCKSKSGNSPAAITVGNVDNADKRWTSSNYGTCVDIWAPGRGIRSGTAKGDNTYGSWTGTSMAAPHVAGAAAILLEKGISGRNVKKMLLSSATTGKVQDVKNSPNRLLFIPTGGETQPDPVMVNAPAPAPAPVPAPGPAPVPTPPSCKAKNRRCSRSSECCKQCRWKKGVKRCR